MWREVLGVERRRRWDDEASLAEVAQRHEVTRQQIYVWRHELKWKGLWFPDAGALFLPDGMVPAVKLTVVEDRIPAVTPVVWVELRLAKGRALRFESNIEDAALSRLVRAVDAA